MSAVRVSVNGAVEEVADGTTVATIAHERAGVQARVAVARNGEVVPRSAWESTVLEAGDAVEVLAPVAGG